ncbi:MAG: hypothetical protein N2505_00365 [Endomicrobia bacterium]|nr:hypothetical protein [Endomicrobiia bacterium]
MKNIKEQVNNSGLYIVDIDIKEREPIRCLLTKEHFVNFVPYLFSGAFVSEELDWLSKLVEEKKEKLIKNDNLKYYDIFYEYITGEKRVKILSDIYKENKKFIIVLLIKKDRTFETIYHELIHYFLSFLKDKFNVQEAISLLFNLEKFILQDIDEKTLDYYQKLMFKLKRNYEVCVQIEEQFTYPISQMFSLITDEWQVHNKEEYILPRATICNKMIQYYLERKNIDLRNIILLEKNIHEYLKEKGYNFPFLLSMKTFSLDVDSFKEVKHDLKLEYFKYVDDKKQMKELLIKASEEILSYYIHHIEDNQLLKINFSLMYKLLSSLGSNLKIDDKFIDIFNTTILPSKNLSFAKHDVGKLEFTTALLNVNLINSRIQELEGDVTNKQKIENLLKIKGLYKGIAY